MLYKWGGGKNGENEEVISRVEDFGAFVWKHGLHWPWMNLHASLIEAALIRPAEREIKPAQNVVTNPFKCGGGSLRCQLARA